MWHSYIPGCSAGDVGVFFPPHDDGVLDCLLMVEPACVHRRGFLQYLFLFKVRQLFFTPAAIVVYPLQQRALMYTHSHTGGR